MNISICAFFHFNFKKVLISLVDGGGKPRMKGVEGI